MTWVNLAARFDDRRAVFLLNTRLERGGYERHVLGRAMEALEKNWPDVAESSLQCLVNALRPPLVHAVFLGIQFDLATWNLQIAVSHGLLDPVPAGQQAPRLPLDPAMDEEFLNTPWAHGHCGPKELARVKAMLSRLNSLQMQMQNADAALQRPVSNETWSGPMTPAEDVAQATARLLSAPDSEPAGDWFRRIMAQPAD